MAIGGDASIGDTIAFNKDFSNTRTGAISAEATVMGYGIASADGVSAINKVGSATAGTGTAYGPNSTGQSGNAFIGDTVGFAGDFDNQGTISASATVKGEGKVSAAGVDVQNSVGSLSGHQTSRGVVYGFAGDFNNGGDIIATAIVTGKTDAHFGNSASAAALKIYTDVNNSYGAYGNSGSVMGIAGDFTNSGRMIATATSAANGDSYAHAFGVSIEGNDYVGINGDFLNNANALISATASAGDNAHAYGVYVENGIDGRVTNLGVISASATASGSSSGAFATGLYSDYVHLDFLNAGTITATSTAGKTANASGIYVNGESDSGFVNTGTVYASAATLSGVDNSQAFAAGISLNGDMDYFGRNTNFTNSGSLTALASTSGRSSEALAFGALLSDYIRGDFINSGTITAVATASSSSSSGEDAAFSSAAGLRLNDNVYGNISNSGYILASATTRGYGNAEAYGMYINGDVYGSFINSSIGVICANATSEHNYAVAYGLNIQNSLYGDFVNHGTISAVATGDFETAYGVRINNSLFGSFTNTGTIVGREFNSNTGHSVYINDMKGNDFINDGILQGAIFVGDNQNDAQVFNNGLLNTRLETSTVEGNYLQSDRGTFQLSVDSTVRGYLSASGNIDIQDGSTIAVHVLPGSTRVNNSSFSIMSAQGDLIVHPDELNIKDTSVAYNFAERQIGDYLFLVVTDTSMTNIASAVASENLKSGEGLAKSLDLALNNFEDLPTKMQDVMYKLGASTNANQVKHTVESLLPTSTGNANLYSHDIISQMNQVVDLRQSYNKGVATGDQFFGDNDIWFKPFGSYANQSDNKGVSGYNANSFGAMFGADVKAGILGSLGASIGYARTNLDPDNVASKVKLNTYQASIYGTKNVMGQTDLSWHVGGGKQDNSMSRTTDGFGRANAKYNSDFITAGAELSYTVNVADNQKFIPSVRMNYSRVSDDGYTESGLGSLNLIVDKLTTERLVLGLDGKYVYKPTSVTNLSANLGVGYDVLQDNEALRARFQGAAGYNCCAAQPVLSFNVATMEPSPWIVKAGLGASYNITNNVDLNARYDLNVKDSYFDQMASARVVVKF
jgi:uncharacterized protein with beta-barrel porin domain